MSPRLAGLAGPASTSKRSRTALVKSPGLWTRRRYLLRDAGDVPLRAIGEEDGAGLRAKREHVARAIVFLVAPRALVLLDDVAVVLVDRKAGREPRLHVAAHAKTVEIDARLV